MAKQGLELFDPDDLVIVEDKEHYLYDERVKLPLDENLVKNICVYGVLHNVIVTREGEKVLVVEGRQRVKAARAANKILKKEGKESIKVPCTTRHDDEVGKYGVMLSANELRQNDPISIKITKLNRFLAMGRSNADAALAFGVTEQSIRNWLMISSCSAPVRKAIESGDIPPTAAMQFAKLEPKEQQEKLDKLMAEAKKTGKRATVRKAKKTVTGKSGLSRKDMIDLRDDKYTPEGFKVFLRYLLGDIGFNKAAETLKWMTSADDAADAEAEKAKKAS